MTSARTTQEIVASSSQGSTNKQVVSYSACPHRQRIKMVAQRRAVTNVSIRAGHLSSEVFYRKVCLCVF